MLKELKLHHWKSFESATLYIDPLTIVIGTNASGKSNTLDALLFLQRVATGVGIFQAINGDVNSAMLPSRMWRNTTPKWVIGSKSSRVMPG
jgi:AAA15 family ATPase/GTPase